MKTTWIAVISAGLGVSLGVATSWARLDRNVAPDPLYAVASEAELVGAPAADGRLPKVVVDEEEFDLGRVAATKTAKHSFVFKNAGDGPLKLTSGGTSCSKCTLSSVPVKAILPGESGEVVVEFHAGERPDSFRHTAVVLTTDPERPRVELTVEGQVVTPLDVRPDKIVFTRLSTAETNTAKLTLVATLDPDFAIDSFQLVDPETAKFFDLAIDPLPADELESLGGKRGYQVTLTVKPGMPLGALRQRLVLHTNLPDVKEVSVPIEGRIESDISIAGPNFDRDHGLLTIGAVGREGAERKLWLRVHGENRHAIKVSVASATPPLEVSVGEPAESSAGSAVQMPLVVKIPPASPSASHLVNLGKILLETSDPDAKQIRIWVQFAVEE
jgi:Protein of unknown function (DUF1573)